MIKTIIFDIGGVLIGYDWTKELKARGYQVLFLSNWSYHLKEQAAKQLDFLPLLDGGVFSCEEKLIKPDHAIYNRILEKYNLKAEKCVFIDDSERNVIGAIECAFTQCMPGIKIMM